MGNPIKRGADPYADALEVQQRMLVALATKNVVVSGANAGFFGSPVNGKLSKVVVVTTVATTAAVTVITVNIDGNDLAATFTIPITAINLVLEFDIDEADTDNVVKNGSKITLTSNAGATAGAVDFIPYIKAVN